MKEQLEREPTQGELASALGIDPTELDSYQTLAQPRQLVSLDEIADNHQGDDQLSLAERLSDPHATTPDRAMLADEDRRLVLHCLHVLPKTQATVVVLHYLQSIPLREVAEILTVTPSRVSQLHHQALGRLRQALKRAHGLR